MNQKPNKPRKTTNQPRGKRMGVIDPSLLYTAQALQSIGIGRPLLMEGRKQGAIKTYTAGRTIWYRGEEIYQWIVSGNARIFEE